MVTNGNFGEKVADYHTMITNSTVDTPAYHNSVSVNGDKVTKVITGDISHKQPYNCLACGQLYKYSSGLSRHRKICSKISNVGENAQATVEIPHLTNQGEFKEIVLMLLLILMLKQQAGQLLVQGIIEFIHLQDQVLFVYLVQVILQVQQQ